MNYPQPNPNKKIDIEVIHQQNEQEQNTQMIFARWPIKTAVITPNSDLPAIILKHTENLLQKDDLIMIAESVVAIAQDRAFKFDEINSGWIATLLSRFVRKVPWGIGLGKPQTMQLAINECGLFRILFAAICAGLGKLFGAKGLFYKLAGLQAAMIDGPCEYKLPPYNQYATLGPKDPQKTARKLSERIGVAIAIMDTNDIGTKCIGAWPKQYSNQQTSILAEKLTKDNPFGQSTEQTPVVLARLRHPSQK
ncbi:MAG: coenzyme F420-0:L-glutamate ligase [Patescibacteria group bacterium]|nr:coenzyme F420-0:L-glutamate ligase [Patescibacteria group bacterium]